ncbi:unnamed protein product [Polarella glacialis]|uniref:Uncharacterized protein n=1 Tax=Polarella glacialis TaxID=89957 RepID=A0A813GYH0_POLGL|nr:unnamed protein product [Polarella glacialis]
MQSAELPTGSTKKCRVQLPCSDGQELPQDKDAGNGERAKEKLSIPFQTSITVMSPAPPVNSAGTMTGVQPCTPSCGGGRSSRSRISRASSRSRRSSTSKAAKAWQCGIFGKTQLLGLFLGLLMALVSVSWQFAPERPLANRMLAVTLFVASCWVFEVLPLPVTSLLPMALIPFSGIKSSEEVAQSYWNWISMLFVGAFVVDAAIEHVELPKRVALNMLAKVGVSRPWAVMATFLFLSYALSMFCSNVATALMLVPFATALLDAATVEAAKIEAAWDEEDAAELAEAEAAEAEGVKPLDRKPEAEAEPASTGRAEGEGASEDGKSNGDWREPPLAQVHRFSVGVLLAIAYGASLGGCATLIGTPVNGVLAGQALVSGQVNFSTWMAYSLPVSLLGLFVAFCVLHVMFTRGVTVPLRIEDLQAERDALTPFRESRDEVLVAVLQVALVMAWALRPYVLSPWLVDHRGDPIVNDAALACLFAATLFLLPSKEHPGEAIMPWGVAEKKVPWGVLLLMGAGFAIAQGFEASGLTEVVGNAIGNSVVGLHPLLLTFIIVMSVTTVTEITSNTATANVLLPLLSAVASDKLINPALLLVPATLACSFAFMLPAATGPNTVVFATGRVKIGDFVKAGTIMKLASSIALTLAAYAMGVLVFQVDQPFPSCQCKPEHSCAWVQAAGVVDGTFVMSQASSRLFRWF